MAAAATLAFEPSELLRAVAGTQSVEFVNRLTVDLPVIEIEGDFLLNGRTIQGYEAGGLATIGLTNRHGDKIWLGGSIGQGYGPTRIVAGEYAPIYAADFTWDEMPINMGAKRFAHFVSLEQGGLVDLDVPSNEIHFEFRINGVPFNFPGNNAKISLRDVETGDESTVGFMGWTSIDVGVIPGVYDVVYTHISGDSIPQNEHAVVMARVNLTSPQTVVVDVRSTRHVIATLLNGAVFPPSVYENARISLRNFETGDVVEYGQTKDGAAERVIVPGVYDVIFTRLLGGKVIPRNLLGKIAADLIVPWAGPNGRLTRTEIDVHGVELSMYLTLDGGAFPVGNYEYAKIYLIGENGDELHLRNTQPGEVTPTLVTAGIYDVYYRRQLGGLIVPRNANALIAKDVELIEDGDLVIDVETIEFTLNPLLDGEAFPLGSSGTYEKADFYLVGGEGDSMLHVNSTYPSSGPRLYIKGTYDIYYDRLLGGEIVPRNKDFRVVQALPLYSDQTYVLDIQTRTLISEFTQNGGPFPADPGQLGGFSLRGPAGGRAQVGWASSFGPYTTKVIEADYAIEYDWVSGAEVPQNRDLQLGYFAATPVPEPGLGSALAAGVLLLAGAGRGRRARR